MVRLQVAQPLRLFLPMRGRATGRLDVADDGTGTVGHVVQAGGIPLTEVGALLVGGSAVAAGERAGSGVVEVHERDRPQPLEGPPRLLLDVHLGALARRLRLLGVDTAYANDADDAALVARANLEDRLLLTQDRRLLMRRGLRRAAFVRGARPDDQLADVLDRFDLPRSPYTLCTACGGRLREVPKAQVLDRLQPGTRRTQEQFRQCEVCERVYWRGAHARRLDELVRGSG